MRLTNYEDEAVPAFAVFSTQSISVKALVNAFSGDDEFPVEVGTIEEAIASKAEVLILSIDRDRQSDLNSEILDALKNRKVIGIGYGAAQIFGKLGLEINGGACMHNTRDYSPKIIIKRNSLIGEPELREPIVAFDLSPDDAHIDSNFAMYIPQKSHLCSVVDVIARWTSDESRDSHHAPIVRPGGVVNNASRNRL